MTIVGRAAVLATLAVTAIASPAAALGLPTVGASASVADEAWWTGPMLANSGATLPRGHALVETYLFEQRGQGSKLRGSLTYLLYGVTDRLTVGLKPMFGSTSVAGRASPIGTGDLTTW